MPKRAATDSLEDVLNGASPLPKRARVEVTPDQDLPPPVNGTAVRPAEQDDVKNDILEAADERAEELQEADALDDTQEAPRQKAPTQGYDDLYLDTINRTLLDFDFEKLCSVTLSNINVYACLVCGKYYQGRGPKSQAYFHALEEGHHVYINMETKRVYVLPEGYEVKSKSLDDIRFVVDPWLTKEELLKLDKETQPNWDLIGRKYIPGFVGMNNIKA